MSIRVPVNWYQVNGTATVHIAVHPELVISDEEISSVPLIRLARGEDFLAAALAGKANNIPVNKIYVGGYDTDIGLKIGNHSWGGSKLLNSSEFDELCKKYIVHIM